VGPHGPVKLATVHFDNDKRRWFTGSESYIRTAKDAGNTWMPQTGTGSAGNGMTVKRTISISGVGLVPIFAFAAAVLLAFSTISRSEARTPEYIYYAMEFDAEIEGERFTFETKVNCWPNMKPSDKWEAIFNRGVSRRRMAFGKKLKSGKGAFVFAPRICELYYEFPLGTEQPKWMMPARAKDILPLIYVTDDYENPNYTTLYTNPNGPDPKTGVRLTRSMIRPLTDVEAAKLPELKSDAHDPFPQQTEMPWMVYYFLRLWDPDEDIVQPEFGAVILETERYRLHRLKKSLGQLIPHHKTPTTRYLTPYMQIITNSYPLDENMPRFRPLSSAWKKSEVAAGMDREWFGKNLPLQFTGQNFIVDFEKPGILHAISPVVFEKFIKPERNHTLVLAGSEVEYKNFKFLSDHLLLHDLKTGHMYGMHFLNLPFVTTMEDKR